MADPPISFATFNVENLAAPGQITYSDEPAQSADRAEAKIAWIADRLRELQADVIGFQEVWSAATLARCFERAGLDYEFAARDGPPDRVQVALAARRGLLRPGFTWIEEFPPQVVLSKAAAPDGPVEVLIRNFSRPVLVAEVAPGVLVFVTHLKSKRPTPLDPVDAAVPGIGPHRDALGRALSQIRRTAEAAALRVLAADRIAGPGQPAVILGDLNDNERSVSTGIITGEPRYVLSASGGAGAAADVSFYATADLQKFRTLKDVLYSYVFNEQPETLDHILVSEEFYDASRRRRWSFRGLRVWNDHIGAGARPRGASDHAIIRANFVPLPAAPPPAPTPTPTPA